MAILRPAVLDIARFLYEKTLDLRDGGRALGAFVEKGLKQIAIRQAADFVQEDERDLHYLVEVQKCRHPAERTGTHPVLARHGAGGDDELLHFGDLFPRFGKRT